MNQAPMHGATIHNAQGAQQPGATGRSNLTALLMLLAGVLCLVGAGVLILG